MGVHQSVGYNKFPKQGANLDKRVSVYFGYDLDRIVEGVIVRDDMEQPFLSIIKLADGRYVMSTECMYSIQA